MFVHISSEFRILTITVCTVLSVHGFCAMKRNYGHVNERNVQFVPIKFNKSFEKCFIIIIIRKFALLLQIKLSDLTY